MSLEWFNLPDPQERPPNPNELGWVVIGVIALVAGSLLYLCRGWF